MKLVIMADLHFNESPQWDNINAITQEMINRIKAKKDSEEEIIFAVLGDIIDKGDNGDNKLKFKNASMFFDNLKREFLNSEFHFIPGNHEINKNGEIVEEFHEFVSQYNFGYKEFTLKNNAYKISKEHVNLIFMDSNLKRDTLKNGFIDTDKLKSMMEENIKTLIFLHHPPCVDQCEDRSLENENTLIATHVELVFFGHQHGFVKTADFSKGDVNTHSVGSLINNDADANNQFLLLDITRGEINYVRRYGLVKYYFVSELLCPKKKKVRAHEIKLIKPEPLTCFIERRYLKYSETNSLSLWINRDNLISESELLAKERFILIKSGAGMGKTMSLKNMYNSFAENKDYFPLWLNLRNTNYETIKEHMNYLKSYTIENKTPILFADGLDELNNEDLNRFSRDMQSAILGDKEVRVVVSVRENYTVYLNNFSEYTILPLTNEDIGLFANKFDDENTKKIIEEIHLRNYDALAQNPFYLIKMIEMYAKNQALPSKKDFYDKIIDILFYESNKKDVDGKDNYILDNEGLLKLKLKNLSTYMSLTQDYSIINSEYTNLISEDSHRNSFQQLGLITKVEANCNIFWEFVHRNFCEILTAKLICDLEFEKLLDVITIGRNHKKIKPSFLNVIGFVLSLRENEDLKRWLSNNAVKELIKMQPENFNEDDKNDIFIKFFEDCMQKNIPVHYSYNMPKLVSYFQSEQLIEYLNSKLQIELNEIQKHSVLNCLNSCSNYYGKDDEILEYIVSNCISDTTEKYIVIVSIQVIQRICNLANRKVSIEIINQLQKDERPDIIVDTNQLIADNDLSEQFSEYILKSLTKQYKPYHSNEYSIKEAAKKFHSNENILKALHVCHAKDFDKRFLHNNFCQQLLSNLIINDENINSLANEITEIYFYYYQLFYREECKDIKRWFVSNNMVSLFLNGILTSEIIKPHMPDILIRTLCEDTIDEFLKLYKEGEILTEWLQSCVSIIPNQMFNKINAAVVKKAGYELESVQQIDYAELDRKGTQDYFDSLFDENKFDHLIDELCKYYSSNTKCKDLIDKGFEKLPHYREDLHKLVTALYHYANEDVELKKFKLINDFSNFVEWQIVKTLENDETIKPNEAQIIYIKKLFDQTNKEYNLAKNNLTDYLEYKISNVIFLSKKFSLEFEDEKLLEFLNLPWYVFSSSTGGSRSEALDFVKERIKDKQILHDTIIENIRKNNLNDLNTPTHIDYCLRKELPDAVQIAVNLLKETKSENSIFKYLAVDYLLKIKDEKYVDNLVNESMEYNLLCVLVDKLKNHNTKLTKTLISLNEQSEDKKIYLGRLLKMNSEYALKKYLDIATETNAIVEGNVREDVVPPITYEIRNTININLFDYIFKLLELSCFKDFKDAKMFGLSSVTINVINNFINSGDTQKLEIIKPQIFNLVVTSNNNHLTMQCNMFLDSIEDRIALLGDTKVNKQEAIKLIREISPQPLSL